MYCGEEVRVSIDISTKCQESLLALDRRNRLVARGLGVQVRQLQGHLAPFSFADADVLELKSDAAQPNGGRLGCDTSTASSWGRSRASERCAPVPAVRAGYLTTSGSSQPGTSAQGVSW